MDVASTLEAVTVYASGAICERRARVAKGTPARLRVGGLPLSMLPGSLRARVVKGPPGLRVLEARPGFDVQLGESLDASVEQRTLDAAERDLSLLQAEAQRVAHEIAELKALGPAYREPRKGEPPREAPVEATLQLAAFVAEALPPLQARKRALDQELQDAQNRRELARRRLAEASNAAPRHAVRTARTAELTLSGVPADDSELVVEYLTPGARWLPAYELRLGTGMTGGLLRMRASVAQRTGEDWQGVRLALSTADLDRRVERPQLRSLRIGRSQPPPPPSGWRDPPPGLDALFAGYDTLPPAPGAIGRAAQSAPMREAEPAPEAAPTPEKAVAKEVRRAMKKAPAPPPPPRPPMMAAPAAGAPAPSMAMSRPPPPRSAPRGGVSLERVASRSRRAPVDEAVDDELASSAVYEEEPSADFDLSLGGGEEGGAPEPEPAVPELDVEEGLLDYDHLALRGPAEPQRGRLQPMSRETIWAAVGIRVEVSAVVALLSLHEQTAFTTLQLPLPEHARDPRESAGAFDYRFTCEGPVDVPSAHGWKHVEVATADVELAPEYQAVPSVEPKVYRTVRVKNRSTHALLAGPVEVFSAGGYLLTAQLPTLPPGGGAETLGLGVEEAIKVARNTSYRESTGGLLGGTAVLTHEIAVDLDNRLPQPATVEVRERVPVTTDEDVKVEEAKIDPAWRKDDQPRDGVVTRGARAWRVTLGPGEKRKLVAEFVLKIPSSKMLQGGNRRV